MSGTSFTRNRNYYFVDFENVQSSGLEGIDNLTEEDEVFIFYSENANRITFELHQSLMRTPAGIYYIPVVVGVKNALDFQLSSYLGYIIYQNLYTRASYYIVTKDTAFSCLVSFWKAQGVELSVIHDLAGKRQADSRQKLQMLVEEKLHDRELADTVTSIMEKCETKQILYKTLLQKLSYLGTDKAAEIYRTVRPLFDTECVASLIELDCVVPLPAS